MELIHECEPMQSAKEEQQGIYEWACVTCGRRVRFTTTPPNMVVLTPGDQMIRHEGAMSLPGLRLSRVRVNEEEP